jgi:hypothetical protein
MKRITVLFFIFLGFITANSPLSMAQKWIPQDLRLSVMLVERFKYQDPNATLADVDDQYEDQKDDFIERTNDNLEPYNVRLDSIYKACQVEYKLVDLGKVDELYPDPVTYRYLLRREAFFGMKKVLNPTTQKNEDQSYCAYRYYFYDRFLKKTYPYYYYSGNQWDQLKRIVFWLNKTK